MTLLEGLPDDLREAVELRVVGRMHGDQLTLQVRGRLGDLDAGIGADAVDLIAIGLRCRCLFEIEQPERRAHEEADPCFFRGDVRADDAGDRSARAGSQRQFVGAALGDLFVGRGHRYGLSTGLVQRSRSNAG